MKFRISRHAKQELKRRRIPTEFLESVLNHPQQVIIEPNGKKIYQSQIDFGSGKIFLLRAIVAEDIDPAVIITVYRTRKINKYWRQS
jgi:hypothetical protein